LPRQEGVELQIAAQIRGWLSHLQMKLAVAWYIEYFTGGINFPLGLPGSSTFSAPLTTVISSGCAVPKVYSPSAITPTLARPVLLLVKPMDFTFPSKYSLL
jgi:hypothetical protein